jgi:hypothetical protein
MFPRLVRVKGPTKSTNSRSKGRELGVLEWKPTAVVWAGFAL